MLKYNCLITIFLLTSMAWGRSGDTLNYYRFKGLDVSFGVMNLQMGGKANANLLKAITPSEYSARYKYDNDSLNSENAFINPVKIDVGIVFGNNQSNNRYFINKHAFIFKFSFETVQVRNTYQAVQSVFNPILFDTAVFSYTYQTQTIGLGYQLSTKPFLKNFALFGGINADFGMVTFKRIDGPRYEYVYPEIGKVDNYSTTIIRGNSTLGLKYNFSCDINFFVQAEFGVLHYGKEIGTNAVYGGGSFGIRYKFLEDQDKLRYNSTGFW